MRKPGLAAPLTIRNALACSPLYGLDGHGFGRRTRQRRRNNTVVRKGSLIALVALPPQLVTISSTKRNNTKMTNDWKMSVLLKQCSRAKDSCQGQWRILFHCFHEDSSHPPTSLDPSCLQEATTMKNNPHLPLKALINASKSP